MAYILSAFVLFAAAIAVHIAYCRSTSVLGLQAKTFCLIAFLFLGLYVVTVVMLKQSGLMQSSMWGLPFAVTAGLIYILLIPVYITFYVLTQLTSPSKRILRAVAQGGEVSYADILVKMEKEEFVSTRIKELCSSGCVVLKDNKYALTPAGAKISAVLDAMEVILGRAAGG